MERQQALLTVCHRDQTGHTYLLSLFTCARYRTHIREHEP